MTLKTTTPKPRRPAAARSSSTHKTSLAATAGQLLAGFVIVGIALTAWALTFIMGGRPVLNDLLHRDLGGTTGVEIAVAGLFGFGGVFILGLGWKIGSTARPAKK